MIAMLVGLLSAGCASSIEGSAPTADVVKVTISEQWSEAQRASIEAGLAFWQSEIDPALTVLDVEVGDCRIGQRACISPVDFEHHLLRDYDDEANPMTVVGHCYFGTIVMWSGLEGSDLELLSAHEFGHFLGLEHAERGIMAPGVGEMSFTVVDSTP